MNSGQQHKALLPFASKQVDKRLPTTSCQDRKYVDSSNKFALLNNYMTNVNVSVLEALYTTCTNDWQELNFMPAFNRLYLICEGDGRIEIGDKSYWPVPGQLVIMPAHVTQSYTTINEHPYSKYWCHFQALVGDRHLFQLMQVPYCITLAPERLQQALHTFQTLTDVHHTAGWTAAFRTQGLLMELLSLYLEEAGFEQVSLPVSAAVEKINEVLHYIECHLSEKISVQQLASLLHLHPNYFITFFREQMGESPIQYINRVKVSRAQQLLLTSDLNVSEIADSIGMDVYYFSRLFKQSTGFTPTSYKQQRVLFSSDPVR
ncbi:AraC family transcriptional regulator [Paenibacillus taiwanensis]|uniref:AraC family transcriptional regulator n=1 Tax=Paenibacillus taiwanensis TaxID=401638 RepID=UPI0003FD9A0C|nr:AraC family transcriptional regulator [Paenibacillus taiwanensis]